MDEEIDSDLADDIDELQEEKDPAIRKGNLLKNDPFFAEQDSLP